MPSKSSNLTRFRAKIFNALSDPIRLEIIEFLRDGEKCVCEITPHLKLIQPVVSRHLKSLKAAGLVKRRKKGDVAQGLINTAINALLMLILYAPLAGFYLGVSSIPVPWDLIAVSVLVFIALPVASGALSRRLIIQRKGEEWFKDVYNPAVGKISIVALLTTLIVLFSLEGQTILNDPLLVGYLAAPNLMHYGIMILWPYPLGYFLGWKYETAIDTTLIGSSSHFEVAIAVATTLYGIGSGVRWQR